MTPRRALFALLPLSLAVLAACADERVSPVGTEDAGVPTAPPPDASTEIPPDAPPTTKKRDVILRNPFGNVAEAQNLLWDGDFEWSSPFTDQYGWIQLPASATIEEVVVGPACRSGVKCARVGKDDAIIGIAVSSAELGLDASIWARFEPDEGEETPPCSAVIAYLLDLGGLDGSDPDTMLVPTSELADEAGYCHLTAASPQRSNKTYLYVENDATVSMLVDDCVVAPSGALPFSQAPPTPALAADKRASALAAVLATRHPVEGKPNPARDALRARKQRGQAPH